MKPSTPRSALSADYLLPGLVGAIAMGGFIALRALRRRRNRKEPEPTTIPADIGKSEGAARDVAVFWDIENMQIPRDVDPSCLGNAIQGAARQLSDSQSLEFVNAYIDTQQLNTNHANSLSQLGFNLIHSPIAKEAADKAIIVDLLIWLLQYEKTRSSDNSPCVVLITRDHDFEPMLYKLRNMDNIHIVLVTEVARVKPHFLTAPNEYFDWQEILAEARLQQRKLGIYPGLSKRELAQDAERRQRAGRDRTRSPGRRKAQRRSRSSTVSKREEGEMGYAEDEEEETFYSSGGETRGSVDTRKGKVGVMAQRSADSEDSRSSTKSLTKKYSSVKPECPTRNDEVADFVLRVLKKNKGTLSTNNIFRLMKNPGAGGGYSLYDFARARDSSGRHVLFSEIKKHKDRFELFKSKRGIWYARLTPGDHKFLCTNRLETADTADSTEAPIQNNGSTRSKRLARKWSFQFIPDSETDEADESG